MDAIAAFLFFDRGDFGAHAEIDAAIAHRRSQAIAKVHVEIAQDLLAAMEHGDGHPEPVEDRGELHADIAGADDDDAAGQLLELEAFVRADEVLPSFHVGNDGISAGRNQDRLRRERAVAIGKLDLMWAGKRGAGQETIDATLPQGPRINAVQAIDLAPHIVEQDRPVEAQSLVSPSEATRIGEIPTVTAAIDEELLRHAAADHAGAADAVFLGDADAGAERRGEARRAHPARARADDEEIVVVPSHLASGSRAA